MRNHNHQTLARDLADKLHDLYARHRIERARRFVGEQYFGVIDERAGDRHALHLTARKLVGAFVQFVFQSDFDQRVLRSLAAFGFGNARDRERQFDVAEHGLVGNEVIGLEHEPDPMISVYVPIVVFVILGGNAADDEIARGVVVKTADNVQKRGLAATGRAENGHELVLTETEGHAFQRLHGRAGGLIVLFNVF